MSYINGKYHKGFDNNILIHMIHTMSDRRKWPQILASRKTLVGAEWT